MQEILTDSVSEQFVVDTYLPLNAMTEAFTAERIKLFADGISGQELHKKLQIPFLKLSLPAFSHEQMLKEALELESRAVGHRSKDNYGWKSLCLHGIASDKTLSSDRYGYSSELEAPYRWTEISEQCPETTRFLKDLLQTEHFERFHRVRFMYLEPGGRINFHQDRDDHNKSLGPLNVALNMPPECHWVFKNWGTVPFEPGSGYAVDISNQHGVWNFSKETRVHLILHGRYGANYYNKIAESVSLRRRELSKHSIVKTPMINEKKPDPTAFANILWKYNPEISNADLFNKCANITEHFMRLKANRQHRLSAGVQLSDLLARCSEMGTKWAFVCTPGTLLKDQFYSCARTFLRDLSENVFLVGHLLDRADRWFGLHAQAFFINVELWEKLGRPHFGGPTQSQKLPLAERSAENVHDDYTPLYLRTAPGSQTFRPQLFGWNWVRAALSANYELVNFPNDLREKKQFLYPEQNQSSLLERFNQIQQPLEALRNKNKLSDHQEEIFESLHIEAYGLDKKIFLFNTEQARSPYQEDRIKKFDLYVGLPAGQMDMHLTQRHQLNENAQFIYFDVNQSMLEIKKEFYTQWDGKDFPAFWRQLESRRPEIFENKLMTVDRDQLLCKWEQELEIWGNETLFLKTFNQIKPLKKTYLQTNIVSSSELLMTELEKYKNLHVALWYSNCFNYTPSLAMLGWNMDALRASGVTFMNSLLRLSKKNNLKITVYGEDVVESFKVPGFGVDINNVFC